MALFIWIICVCLLTLGVPVWTIVTPTAGSATEASSRVSLVRSPKSQTVENGKRLELLCSGVGDGPITYRWYLNGTKKENEIRFSSFFKVLKNGTLRFKEVKVVDRGVYYCRAENAYKDYVFSEPAVLTVHTPAVLIKPKANATQERIWDVGSTRHLVCEAAGIPPPTIDWRRDGELISADGENPYENRTDRGTKVTLRSVLSVDVTSSANYSCTARNYLNHRNVSTRPNPRTNSSTTKVTAVNVPDTPGQDAPPVMCRPYTGSFCKNYLGSSYVMTPTTPGATTSPGEAVRYLDLLLKAHMDDLTMQGLFASSRTGSDICMKPARRIICHLAFPTCILPESAPRGGAPVKGTPLPICRESCQAVTNVLCLRQYASVQLLKNNGTLTGKLGLLGMPDCPSLPSKLDRSHTPGRPVCTESDHHSFHTNKVTSTCYVDRGRWYNGTVSVTKSGHTCQRWDQTSPQPHTRTAHIFPEIKDAANFCRNPGGEEESPWCYTTHKYTRYELCDIKPCAGSGGGEGTKETGGGGEVDKTNENEEEEQSVHMLLLIIGAPCAALLIIFVVVLLCLCCRRRRYSSAPGDDVDVDVDGLTVNSAYYTPTRLNPKLEAIEFPRNDLVFVERVGQGAFGMVFKARVVCSNGNSRLGGGTGGGGMFGSKLSTSKQSLGFNDSKPSRNTRNPFSSKGEFQHIEFHDPLGKTSCDSKLLSSEHTTNDHQIPGKGESNNREGEGEGQIVAVKMLKEDASESIQTDFEREASLMVEFEHENIVRLLGVCTIGRPLCLLFEYMSHGDLNDYLQFCSPDRCLVRPLPNTTHSESSHPTRLKCRGDSSHSLDTADHLHIARQVCAGMVYLSDRGYVHRDLATRNCLVGEQLTVKISDFGLARSVHSMDYYRGSDRDAVPIRWMPPEAILYNKFSSQSDVWSFGVLLWEVFSYAFQPYYGLTHEEVIAALRAGRTLDPPEAAPPAVYSLMKSCWRTKPSSRPSFSSLQKCLVSMHEEACRTKVGLGNMRL